VPNLLANRFEKHNASGEEAQIVIAVGG